MENGEKRRIGTVEGVALILSLLACLVLFFKIMPNINSNMEFFTEKVGELDQEISKLQIAQDNLLRSCCADGDLSMEINELRNIGMVLDGVSTRLPDQKQQELMKLKDSLNDFAESLRH